MSTEVVPQVALFKNATLYPFQEEGIARAYLATADGGGQMVCWDTGCIYGDADIIVNRGGASRHYPLSEVVRMFNGGETKNHRVWRQDIPTRVQREAADGTLRLPTLDGAWESGVKQTYTVTTSTGRTIRATDEHPFLTERGWLRLDELRKGDEVHVRGFQVVHHKDHDPSNNELDNLQVMIPEEHQRLHAEEGKTASVLYKVVTEAIVSVEPFGEEMTYDLSVVDDPHNFLADGFVVHNTGKSIFAMRMATLLFEDDEIDLCLVVAEQNKIGDDEWCGDFRKFTDLSVLKHHGTNRRRRLDRDGLPQVLVTTYETGKADLVSVVKTPGKRGTSMENGWLMEQISGRRVLVVLDEVSAKLSNRSSATYKAWNRTLTHLRQGYAKTRVLGLTATPIERDWESAFNQMRQIVPMHMMLVSDFEKQFVRNRDIYDRPRYQEHRMHLFASQCHPHILRKRKTDSDVVDVFPKQVEEARWVEMAADQRSLYEAVESLQDPAEDPIPGLWTALRQIASYPASVAYSASHGTSALAAMLVEEWGEQRFTDCSSVKTTALLDYVVPLVKGQGEKVVVFTFFGPSVIPLLSRDLQAKGIRVYQTYGTGRTQAQNEAERTAFRTDPQPCVLLTSDSGARGVNLPESSYVCEYESALTFALRTQRISRCHRIDSTKVSVTCLTFFVRDTVEESIARHMIERNSQADTLLGDDLDDVGESFLSAEQRRAALQISHTRRTRKATS